MMRNLWQMLVAVAIIFPRGETISQDTASRQLSAGLGRGVNFGNALELEIPDRRLVTPAMFKLAKDAGFQHIRLPVRFSIYADQTPPYAIKAEIFQAVDNAIENALINNLKIIITNHHYKSFHYDPESELIRARAIWNQIANRYRKEDLNLVFFEILNEPKQEFSRKIDFWNTHVAQALRTIRETNPDRKVIIGPVDYNKTSALSKLILPDDRNLIATVHFYDPHVFTHQGEKIIKNEKHDAINWATTDLALSGDWMMESWRDASAIQGPQGIDVVFKKQHSGIQFSAREKIFAEKYDRLNLEIEGDAKLTIEYCEKNQKAELLETEKGKKSYIVPLKQCIDDKGNEYDLEIIILKNELASSESKFSIKSLTLGGRYGATPVFTAKGKAIRLTLEKAANWAKIHRHPLYLGEFGVSNKAQNAARGRWVEAVRFTAEEFGINWSYWAFASEDYGFLDPNSKTPVPELKDALFGTRSSDADKNSRPSGYR